MRRFLFILILLGANGLSVAEVVKTVRASGVGLVIDGDLHGGFEQAKKAAMRQAVEEGVGVLVTSRTRLQNLTVIEDGILTRTEGYIRNLEVVEHGLSDDHTYQVTIDATVSLGDLRQRLEGLELLIESAGSPRILCLGRERLREKGTLREADWGVVAHQLEQVLRQTSRHFRLIVPQVREGERRYPGPETAVRFGQQQGADIIIRGEAIVQDAAGIRIPNSPSSLRGKGIHSATAELRVEALWTDSGEVFAALSGTGRAAGATLQTAAEKAIHLGMSTLRDSLLDELAEDWREKIYSGRLIRLVVQGSEAQLRSFEREFPRRVNGVENMNPRRRGAGRRVYDIRAPGSGFDVARQLAGRGLGGALQVDILQVTAHTLELHLEPASGAHDSSRADQSE
jgi:hypothetical protein